LPCATAEAWAARGRVAASAKQGREDGKAVNIHKMEIKTSRLPDFPAIITNVSFETASLC